MFYQIFMDFQKVIVHNPELNMKQRQGRAVRAGRPARTEEIRKWRRAHPKGTPEKCIEATGIPRATVYRNWDKCGPVLVSDRECVISWRRAHPEGRQCECHHELGISRSYLSEIWNDTSPEPSGKESE